MKFLELIDPERWQKIQDCLAAILDLPLRIIGSEGEDLVRPSRQPAVCGEVVAAVAPAAAQCRQWYPHVVTTRLSAPEVATSYQGLCPLGFSTVLMPIAAARLAPIFLVIGPLVREQSHTHAHLTQRIQEYGIDEARFFAGYNMLPLVDDTRLADSMALLRMLIGFAATVSEFAGDSDQPPALLDKQSVGMLLRQFLNLAMKLCGAEIGSIMMFEQQSQELSIQDAEGLSKEIIDTTKIKPGEGIAGLSIQRRESLFVNDQLRDREVRLRMRKPKIKSAFVIPVFYKSDILGVVSVATAAFPNRFCDTLMELLNELVAMALEKVNLQ